jgi:hypothetical protein
MGPGASYPNFAGKHGHEAIFSPAEVVAALTAGGPAPAPDAVILTYQPFLLDELRERGEAGIGKSTVWYEAVRLAEARGYRVLRARPHLLS